MVWQVKNLLGQRFGRFIVTKSLGLNKCGHAIWECTCDCGNIRIVVGGDLTRGKRKSCGCLRVDYGRSSGARLLRHGHAAGGKFSRTYRSWHAMHQRCSNKNDDRYENYGGRGIKVCERWGSFENFLADMGERPAGLSLHRTDNDGNYEPGNCKWATSKEQASNRRLPKRKEKETMNEADCRVFVCPEDTQ